MDSTISSALGLRLGIDANQRQITVAAAAARTEKATVATLLDAIQQSASYGAGGQAIGGGGIGTRFSGVA
jgi:hypothetical protein